MFGVNSGYCMERAKSAHLAVLVVIMSAAEEELERLLVAEDGGPRERGIPLVVRIRVAYVRPLDQTFDEKEIILCGADGLSGVKVE